MHVRALALVGAAALAFGSAANAAVTIDSSTMSTTGPTQIGSTWTIGYSDTDVAASINENVVFTDTLAGVYSISLTTSSPDVNFTSAILTGPGGSSNALSKTFDDGTNEAWNFTSPATRTLPSGQYTLSILGTNSGAGSLGGSITINAVPEPATWALMLLGFAGMGFALRRGRQPGLMQLA